MADETIVIDGDASGALAAIQALQRRLQSLQGDLAEVRAADARASAAGRADAAAWKARADNLNVWKRAASGVAPQLTGIIDSFEEFAEGAEKIGGAAMAARVGVLALGSAAAAGATAFVAAGAAMVASSLQVINNLGQYNIAATKHRAALIQASQATAGLHEAITGLRVEIAGQMAPAITAVSDTLTGLTQAGTNAVRWVGQFGEAASVAFGAASAAAQRVIPLLDKVVWLTDKLRIAGAAQREEQERQTKALAAYSDALDEENRIEQARADFESTMLARTQAQLDKIRDDWKKAESDAKERQRDAEQRAAEAQRRADQVQSSMEQATAGVSSAWARATHEIDLYVEALTQADRAQAIMRGNLESGPQARNIQAGRAAQTSDMPSDPNEAAALATNAQDAAWNAAKSTSAAWRSAAADVLSSTGSMIGSVGNFIAESYAKQAEGANKYSQAHRNALRKQFAAQKAAALAQAAIGLALGIMQVWSTWSALPPVAAALTAVVGAIGAVQIGLIAAQKPSFHRGGIYQMSPGQAPDERSASLSMLQTERLAVIPQRGALGSESEVARQSTGEDRGQGAAPAPVVYIMDGSGRRTTRLFAGLSPLMGRRRIA